MDGEFFLQRFLYENRYMNLAHDTMKLYIKLESFLAKFAHSLPLYSPL